MNEQRLKSDPRRAIFQQKKPAEELANGMPVDVCIATREQLCYEVKEKEIIKASAKAAGDEAATWPANSAKCAEHKPKFPSRTLSY